MRHVELDEEGPVSDRADSQLLHLLTCPVCREEAIGHLLDRQRSAEEEEVHDYSAAFRALEARSPELIEEARRRRSEAEALLAELKRMPHQQRLRKLHAERFQSPVLLDLLLEESQVRQLTDPCLAGDLAVLAARLAVRLDREPETTVAALCRSLCLQVSARRLRGDLAGADKLLGRTPAFLEVPMDRAFYCRTIALLRWEQGRRDETAALLHQAALLYSSEGFTSEEGLCLTLLGLFHLEQGTAASALPLLLEGWTGLDRERDCSVALRTGLSLAFLLADAGQEERARNLLHESWRLYSRETDLAEMARVYWLEARALGRLGAAEEARNILESVLARLGEEGSLAESALVALDLIVVLAESGEVSNLDRLARHLRTTFPANPVLVPALSGVANLAELARLRAPGLREAAHRIAVTLRRTFRGARLWIKPLPFA